MTHWTPCSGAWVCGVGVGWFFVGSVFCLSARCGFVVLVCLGPYYQRFPIHT